MANLWLRNKILKSIRMQITVWKKYHCVLADCVDVNQIVRTVANEIPTSNEPIRNPCNNERGAEIFNRFVCLINLNSLIQS
jgi:hypothetical protein